MIETIIIGHLGKDAVLKEHNGKKVLNYSIAHSEKYKDQQGTVVEKTTWVECSQWSEKTAIAQYLKKGTLVAITSNSIEAHAYVNKENIACASLRCRVNTIQLLGGSKTDAPVAQATAQTTPTAPNVTAFPPAGTPSAEIADDLPF